MQARKSVSGTGTLSLFFINLIFFTLLNIVPDTKEFILYDPNLGWGTKPWTMITVFFSHEVAFHLFTNMAFLLYFGLHLEKLMGGKSVIWIYLCSGILGILTMPFLAPIIQFEGLVSGASGATFAIVGAFAAIKPKHRFIKKGSKALNILLGGDVKTVAILLFVFNLLLYVMNPSVSIGAGAHAIGLLFGVLCGISFKKKKGSIENDSF